MQEQIVTSAPAPVLPAADAAPLETGEGLQRFPIQCRLTVGAVDDPLEKEADAMADKVMRMPEPFVQRKCSHCEAEEQLQRKPLVSFIQRKCPHCAGEDKVQRKSSVSFLQKKEAEGGGVAGEALSSAIQSSGGNGTVMDSGTLNFMESRFGADFSGVKIHTGGDAVNLSRALNAQAFTVGSDIYFNEGKYNPQSDSGKHLLAHELTHTVQQGKGISRSIQRLVDNVEINCGDNQIKFSHDGEITAYDLNHCNISDGNYVANVHLSPGHVDFDLGVVAEGTQFDFGYDIGPGQTNPNIFFRGQRTVPITCTHVASMGGGSRAFDVTFESVPMSPVSPAGTGSSVGLPTMGYIPAVAGSSGRLLAMGNLGWLNAGGNMRWGTMMGGTTWNPMLNIFPEGNAMFLDRIIDIGDGSTRATSDLVSALEPRLQSQLRTGGPYSWVAERGFTAEELTSIEELTRRMNTRGISSLSEPELALLRRAVNLHFEGAMHGSPFASYTPPGRTAPFLEGLPATGDVRYRVRVRVNAASVLDGITPSAFNEMGSYELTNPAEFDMLVTTNANGELQSVQRVASGAEAPGWMMRNAGAVRWGGRLLLVVGAGLSAHHIATASDEERPRVVAEEAGSWGGGYLGAELGVGACIALGIVTEGVGLLVCGLVGGVGGGFAGSHAATGAYDAAPGVVDTITQPLREGYNWMDRGVRDLYGISGLGLGF